MSTSEEVLSHFGTKGMKWGVRNDTSSSGSSAKTKATPARFTKNQKVAAAVGIGATVAAAMVAGPLGDMLVSGITKAVNSLPVTTTFRENEARLDRISSEAAAITSELAADNARLTSYRSK
jgi:hypothetical protein